MRKVEVLNGLRGIAVLLVLYAHVPQMGSDMFSFYVKRSSHILNTAYIGVDIFFVLSGFLITRILINEKSNNNLSFKRFYLKRALRIFPIYYLSILFVGFVVSWKDMAPVALYYSNYFFALNRESHPFSHTWSLSVEEHFYLIWPFIISLFSLSQAKKIIAYVFPAIAILTALVTILLVAENDAYELIYRGTTYRILSLSVGSFLAFKELSLVQAKKSWVYFILAFLLLAAFKLYNAAGLPINYVYLPVFSAISCFIFLGTISLEKSKSLLRRIFVNRAIVFIGQISYGIYLYHFPILYMMGITQYQIGNTPVGWLKGVTAIMLCFAIPILSYYLIEKPFLHLKKKLVTDHKGPVETGSRQTMVQIVNE